MFYFQTIRKARDSVFKFKVKKILRSKFRVLAFFVCSGMVPYFSILFTITKTRSVF
jgi:hypothetical protein